MTDVILEGSEIHTESDLHCALERQLDLGSYYGRNIAALNDRLSTDVERPVHVVWKDSDESRKYLGDELFVKIVRLFTKITEQDEAYGWDERFDFVLE